MNYCSIYNPYFPLQALLLQWDMCAISNFEQFIILSTPQQVQYSSADELSIYCMHVYQFIILFLPQLSDVCQILVCFPWPGSVVTLMRITIGKLKSLVQCCECVAANTSTGKQTRSANSPIVTFQLARAAIEIQRTLKWMKRLF
jgi:hypothetical protein